MSSESGANKKYTNLDLMANAPVRKAILTLAAPTILSQTLTLMFSMVSAFCLGRMGDSYQMAAVTLSMPVTIGIQAIGNIFATGTPPSLSRKLGAKDYAEAKRISAVSFYTAIAISITSIIVFYIFRNPLLNFMGTSPNTYGPTKTYVTIVATFSFATVIMVSLSGTIRSEGNTKGSMIGMGGGAIVNIVLTPLFIFVFKWGIAGAAWATVCANSFTMFYFLSLFVRKKSKLSISIKDFKPSREIYFNILKFGIPMACNNLLTSVSGVLCNRVGASYSDAVVAGYGVSHRLYQITYSLNFGFCLGYQPFAAYNYGAGNYKRLISALKVSLTYSTCIGTAMALIFLIIPEPVTRIFSSDPEVIDVSVRMLRALAFATPFLGCQNAFMYTLQGVDMPSRSMVLSIGRQGLYIPSIYLFSGLFGLTGYIFSQTVSELAIVAIGALITLPIIRKISKMEDRLPEAPQEQ